MSSARCAASYWVKAAATSWRMVSVTNSSRRCAAVVSANAAAMLPWLRLRTGRVTVTPAADVVKDVLDGLGARHSP